MRKIVPQRIIRSRLRLVITLLGLFLLTIGCCVVWIYIISTHSGIISPLAKYISVVKDAGTTKTLTMQLCKKDMIPCNDVAIQSDGSIQITLDSGTLVELSNHKSLEEQMASLQKVASQLTIKGKTIKQIDFRFRNVTVTF